MIKLEESDGGVRRKHRGKSQFAILFFFFSPPPLSQPVGGGSRAPGLALPDMLGELEAEEGPLCSDPALGHRPASGANVPVLKSCVGWVTPHPV